MSDDIPTKDRIQKAFDDLLAQEKRRLFAPLARYLAEHYQRDAVQIANLCDEKLDPTGNLLGWVRIEAGKLRSKS